MTFSRSVTPTQLLILLIVSCVSFLTAGSSAGSVEAAKPQLLASVGAVAFSPDGKLFASTDVYEWIHLWDLRTGTVVRNIGGHDNYERSGINRVLFTREGERIISASDDGSVKIWDVATGKLIADLHEHHDAVTDLALSPDGKFSPPEAGTDK